MKLISLPIHSYATNKKFVFQLELKYNLACRQMIDTIRHMI